MPDPLFSHPRLATVHDAFDGDREDLDHYVDILRGLGAASVVDIGCGTGSLAVRLAQEGLVVIGVDPAAESLAVARAKPGGDAVTWVHGDASVLPALGADAATMTGNVAQVFLTDEEWRSTLAHVHDALRPGGHLVVETRRPHDRAWEGWGTGEAPVARRVPGAGQVEMRREVTDVDLPFVSFRAAYTFASDGAVITSESRLVFRSREEMETTLHEAGFTVEEVRGAPDRPGRELVFIARHD